MTRLLTYIGLILGAIIVLFPLFWMVSVAFKPPAEVFDTTLFPKTPTLKNMQDVLFKYKFLRFFGNSLFVAGVSAALTTFFATMAAYAFAKKNFFGKEQLYSLLLASMMVPGLMYMVPQFALVYQIGEIEFLGIGHILKRLQLMGIDTYGAMIVPHLSNVFGLFMMRQFLSTVPDSLIESASLDGASEWTIFSKIIVPLSLPIIATLFLLSFQFHWSNFLWQLVVTGSESHYTVPVGLAMFKNQHEEMWNLKMAASCISILPIALIFIIAQRFFIEGMTGGAVKE